MQRSTEEIKEIERHKYFLSEKRGHDVGWEFAEMDWERAYGETWRRQRAVPTAGCCGAAGADMVSGCSTSAASNGEGHAERRSHEETLGAVVRRDPPAGASGRGPLGWLLSRLFSTQRP